MVLVHHNSIFLHKNVDLQLPSARGLLLVY